ncbi:hypothetical protein ACFFV7_53390 [Nonomuraea spiralis]|uniref:Uncharacterized protein n=1 Tax=Nonomuraea spiralis TaxID=46182 RepID=A0ABV5IZQ6_9ACTN|nr:hypothetical protein [Nonomuraea spiralis]GGT44250.1 hypothetical protein GCM10010176_104620 [Nonomuraea spiralis]
MPDKWTVSADGWGLGWTLYDWDGVPGYGHDGATIGQYADLFRELLAELTGVTMPAPFGPPVQSPAVDLAPLVGTYRREGVVITVSRDATAAPACATSSSTA